SKSGLENQFLPEEFASGRSQKVVGAFEVAKEIHAGEVRKTFPFEPYIYHCVAVASILEKWGADEDSVIAGLLHDTVENHPDKISLEKIEELFEERVAFLVDGVTKL